MKRKIGLNVLTVILLCLFSLLFFVGSCAAMPGKDEKESIFKSYAQMPLSFIENKGQLDPKVRFCVKTSGQTLYFTDEGIVFDLLRPENSATKGAERGRSSTEVKRERLVFNLWFENGRKGVLIEGRDRQVARINSFVSNDRSKWKTGISTYKGIVYCGIYQGIDLKVFGTGRDIEYEFVVHPGANPKDILLTYHGIEGLATNRRGELLIATAFGEFKETRPYFYQEIEGKRMVAGSFDIHGPAGKSPAGNFSYGFRVASYNPSYPLIIDPTLLFSTYLGGSGVDSGRGIAVDGTGNVYVTGYTGSGNFPTQNPYQGMIASNDDVFITKLSSSGTTLIYSTYFGGSGYDRGSRIAVDHDGKAYITGHTSSSDFPRQNSCQETFAGGPYDAFVTKLTSLGALSYSTYLGGSGDDIGRDIAVDGSGNAYVTGYTNSSDSSETPFPTQSPFQGGNAGNEDVFVTKLSSSGNTLLYSTYLGGSSYDNGYGIAVDEAGNAYVTGYTQSSSSSFTPFPTQGPWQGDNAGGNDAFVTKLSLSGNSLMYSTYLGGSLDDIGNGIAVDGAGNAYVTGYTQSSDFPTHNPFQGDDNAGNNDAFVTKINSLGNALSYSTYLGGSGYDNGYGIAVDRAGNAYVTGYTNSSSSSEIPFPTQRPFQGDNAGSNDVFVTKFTPLGNALSYSTYLGGSDADIGYSIAVDRAGNAYVTGYTSSSDFPKHNPYQETYGAGSKDAFVTKLRGFVSATSQLLILLGQ